MMMAYLPDAAKGSSQGSPVNLRWGLGVARYKRHDACMATTPNTEVVWRRVGRFTEADHEAIVTEARAIGRRHAGVSRLLDALSLEALVLRNPAGIGWRMITLDLTMAESMEIREIAMVAYLEEANR
jgi:hypothetical protein